MHIFLYIGRATVLFHVLVMLSQVLSNKSQKEQAYSDVLKNITLANKLLQDLLKSYERLEKIYQSKELSQSDSSSHEIDQNFKGFMSSEQNSKQRDRSYKKHTSSPYRGTAMIYASESVEEELENTKDEVKEVNTGQPIKSHPDYVHDDIIVQSSINQVSNKNIAHEKVLNSKKEVIVTNNSFNKNKAKSKERSLEESDEVEQIIIDIPQYVSGEDGDIKDTSAISIATTTTHKSIVKSDSKKSIKNILGEKTRFSIQHKAPKRIDRKNLSGKQNKMKNSGRRIKKIVYSESFSPDKIWQEILNKRVSLSKHREQNFRKSAKTKNNQKSKNNQTITIIIITHNKKDSKKPKTNTKETLQKLDFLKKMTRSEYGETCLQMPIKKCKKALKIVNKNICKRRFKCKSDFKSDFIQNSKDGCNKEFAYREETANSNNNKTTKENIEKFSPPEFRELKKKKFKKKHKRQNVNVLPEYKLQPQEDFISLRNDTPQNALEFLRAKKDKYEKKCQKESTKKCNNACNYAIKETCTVHTCEKRKKKAMKSECKDQCKKAYIDVRQSIKSSSKSDSDSESDSGSTSDSDSD